MFGFISWNHVKTACNKMFCDRLQLRAIFSFTFRRNGRPWTSNVEFSWAQYALRKSNHMWLLEFVTLIIAFARKLVAGGATVTLWSRLWSVCTRRFPTELRWWVRFNPSAGALRVHGIFGYVEVKDFMNATEVSPCRQYSASFQLNSRLLMDSHQDRSTSGHRFTIEECTTFCTNIEQTTS